MNWPLSSQSPSLRVECGKSGRNVYIMKQMLVLCAFSLQAPPEDNTPAWTLIAQELLTWASHPSAFCVFFLFIRKRGLMVPSVTHGCLFLGCVCKGRGRGGGSSTSNLLTCNTFFCHSLTAQVHFLKLHHMSPISSLNK